MINGGFTSPHFYVIIFYIKKGMLKMNFEVRYYKGLPIVLIDVSNAQAYKQFGNAVTVNVSRAVAIEIRRKLEEIGEWH